MQNVGNRISVDLQRICRAVKCRYDTMILHHPDTLSTKWPISRLGDFIVAPTSSMIYSFHIFIISFFGLLLKLSPHATVIACLNSRSNDPNSPIKTISFCVDCPSPEIEGSITTGLLPRHGIKEYFFMGELVYSIPNYAEKNNILNKHQFPDRIVFVNRGMIPFLDKVTRLQHAGASAIIIADDGQCDDDFIFCGTRSGSAREGGFASHDDKLKWDAINIPILLITRKSADKLRDLMRVEYMPIPRMGMQNVTVLRNFNGELEL